MAGRGDKGLLITTGSFTPDAVREASREGVPPIDLIDGDRLCDQLLEHQIGAQTDGPHVSTQWRNPSLSTAETTTPTTGHNNPLQESDSLPLSPEQDRAIACLLAGLSDQKVADAIGRHRVTITKWRLYDPRFREELFNRRRRLWQQSVDGLRSLLPGALESLRDQLAVAPNRSKLALELLTKVGLMGKPYSGRLASPELEDDAAEDDADPYADEDTGSDSTGFDPHAPVTSRMSSFS